MKKYIVFCCISAVICLVAIAVFATQHKTNQKYYISGEVVSVNVTSTLDGLFDSGPKQTSNKDDIAVLLECIKKVRINNQKRIKDIETAPISYNVTFTFQNGQTESYEYKVYPAAECNNPFAEFYELFS